MSNYEITRIADFEDPFTHFALFLNFDPTTFEVVVKERKWKKAMDEQI